MTDNPFSPPLEIRTDPTRWSLNPVRGATAVALATIAGFAVSLSIFGIERSEGANVIFHDAYLSISSLGPFSAMLLGIPVFLAAAAVPTYLPAGRYRYGTTLAFVTFVSLGISLLLSWFFLTPESPVRTDSLSASSLGAILLPPVLVASTLALFRVIAFPERRTESDVASDNAPAP